MDNKTWVEGLQKGVWTARSKRLATRKKQKSKYAFLSFFHFRLSILRFIIIIICRSNVEVYCWLFRRVRTPFSTSWESRARSCPTGATCPCFSTLQNRLVNLYISTYRLERLRRLETPTFFLSLVRSVSDDGIFGPACRERDCSFRPAPFHSVCPLHPLPSKTIEKKLPVLSHLPLLFVATFTKRQLPPGRYGKFGEIGPCGGGDRGEGGYGWGLEFRIALVPMCFVNFRMLSCMHCRAEKIISLGTSIHFRRLSLGRVFGFKLVWCGSRMPFYPDPIRIKLFHILAHARIMFLRGNNSSWLPGAENPASAEQPAGARPPAAASRGGAWRLRPTTGQSRQAGQ
jgi:hypothetical protein